MADNFFKVKIFNVTTEKSVDMKMEKGVIFQNNGGSYCIFNDGKLKFKPEGSNIWQDAKDIKMTNYQIQAFKAVSDNDNAEGLSKKDIEKAMNQYSKGELTADLQKELPMGYSVETHSTGNTNKLKNGIEIGIAYNGAHKASLKFQTTDDTIIQESKSTNTEKTSTKSSNDSKVPVTRKEPPTKEVISSTDSIKIVSYKNNPQAPKILSEDILSHNSFFQKEKYIDFEPAETYKIQKGDSLQKLVKKYSIDYYELFAANPELDYKVTYNKTQQAKLDMLGILHIGQEITIPARYKIKPDSIKSVNDIVSATGVTEEYLKEVLFKMEPKKPDQPDLNAYYDGVNGKGVLTIGFGHTGKYLDNQPLTENSKITEEQAYEILAQDILNNKVRLLSYLEQYGISKKDFDKIPASLQSALIDISFNKGIFDGFENDFHDYTSQLKKDLNAEDYASATVHTIRLSNVAGLEKRSMYRLITATKGLKAKDKTKVTRDTTANGEIARIIKRLKDKKHVTEAQNLEQAWNNLKTN